MARSSGEKISIAIGLLLIFGVPLYWVVMIITSIAAGVHNHFFTPLEMTRSKEDVQECAVIASSLASGGSVQERLFDVCLKKEWNE